MAVTTIGGRYATNGTSRFGPSAEVTRYNQLNLNMELALGANPWLAEDPEALLRIAESGMDPLTIANQGAALAGIQSIDKMANSISGLNPVAQRAIYNKLSEGQQRALSQIGWQPESSDDGGWFDNTPLAPVFGATADVLGVAMQPLKYTAVPVIKGGLDALNWVGDVPGHFYRAIRQMDDWQQWVALGAAGLTIAALAASGPLGWGAGAAYLAGAGTFGTFGTLGAFGAAGLGAATLSTGLTAITNPTEWWDVMNPFGKNGIGRGETVFTQQAQYKAKDALGSAGHIDALARDIAVEWDSYDFAQEFAGVRDATGEQAMMSSVQRLADQLADPGTEEHQRVFAGLLSLTQQPEFMAAVDELQAGKISFGRDIANVAGLEQGTTGYSLLSGSVDAGWLLAMDPLLMMGKIGQVKNLARRGMDQGSAAEAVQRMTKMVNEDPAVGATVAQVSAAIDAERFSQMPKEWRSMYQPLIEHKRRLAVQGKAPEKFQTENFMEYVESGQFLRRLMEGKATIRGNEKIIVSARNSNAGMGQVVEQLRQFNKGLTDVVYSDDIHRMAKRAGVEADIEKALPSNYAERAIDMKFEYRELDAVPINETAGYAAGKAFGNGLLYVPGGRTLGNFIGGISTMIPAGSALKLTPSSADDIRDMAEDLPRFVEAMGRHMNMPSGLRDEWLDTIMMQQNVAARRNAVVSFMDSAFEATGFRTLDSFAANADEFLLKYKQSYALGGHDVAETFYGARKLGVLPEAHSAVYMVMPDLREMVKLYRSGHILKNVARITDSDFAEQSMARVIKPGWLLRIGFIPRAAGEEMLAFWVRMSEGGVIQETAARTVAKREDALDALDALRAADGRVGELTDAQRHALRSYRVPGHMAPLVWAQRRNGWKNVDELWTDRYIAWQASVRRDGLLGFEEAGAHLPDWADSIVYGKEHSFRRMLAEGVDEDLLEAARLWTGQHMTQVMRATSARNASDWEREIINPQNTMPYEDPKRPGRTREVPVRFNGEYERVGQGDIRYSAGVHHRAGEWSNDQVVAPIFADELTHFLDAGAMEALDQTEFVKGLVNLRVADGNHSQRLVSELLDYRADNALQQAQSFRKHFPEMADILEDAARRDEFTARGIIDRIEQRKSVVMLEERQKVAKHNAKVKAERKGKTWTVREPAKIPAWNRLNKVQARLEQIEPTLLWMDTLDDSTRAWVAANYTKQMASNHNAYDIRALNRWANGDPNARPKRIYYRGISDDYATKIDPDTGDLLMIPQKQGHWQHAAKRAGAGDVYAVSFSTDANQSFGSYASNRGLIDQIDSTKQWDSGAMVEIDADYLDGQWNTSWDELVANPVSYHTPEFSGDGLYLSGLAADAETRPFTEVAFVSISDEPLRIPAGKWRMQTSQEMEDIRDAALAIPASQRSEYERWAASVSTDIDGVKNEVLFPETNKRINDFVDNLTDQERIALSDAMADSEGYWVEKWEDPSYWTQLQNDIDGEFVFADAVMYGINPEDYADDVVLHGLAIKLNELLDSKIEGVSVAKVLEDLTGNANQGMLHLEDVFRERLGQERLIALFPTTERRGLEAAPGNVPNLMLKGGFDLRGQGQFGSPDLDAWSPFTTNIDELRERLINRVAAELAKPQHNDVVKVAEQPLHLSGGDPIARAPADGTTRIYTPVVAPNNKRIERLLDELETADQELNAALRPSYRLLQNLHVSDTPFEDVENVARYLMPLDGYPIAAQPEMQRVLDEVHQLWASVRWDGMTPEQADHVQKILERAEGYEDQFDLLIGPLYTALDEMNVRTYSGVAKRVLESPKAHQFRPASLDEMTEAEQVELVARALRLYDASRGRYQVGISQTLDGMAFDDPRIAKWLTTLLSDDEAALTVGMLDVPRNVTYGQGTRIDGVRLGGGNAASRHWDVDDRYTGMATPMQANHFTHVPVKVTNPVTGKTEDTFDVVPGASWEQALHQWAERIVDSQMPNIRRGVHERQVFKGIEGDRQIARRVGNQYVNLEPGEKLDHIEDLYWIKDGQVSDAVSFGDTRYFDHSVTEYDDELMNSIVMPFVRDHYEAEAGLMTNGPVTFSERRGRFGKTKPVATDEELAPDSIRRFTRARIEDVQKESRTPNVAMAQGYEIVNDTTWDRIVRYGFDKVIGPALDTLARHPMSFHYFAKAYKQNKVNYAWLLNRELFDSFAVEWADSLSLLDGEYHKWDERFDQIREVARQVNGDYVADKLQTPEDVIQWINGVENSKHGGSWDEFLTVAEKRMKYNAMADVERRNAPIDAVEEYDDYRFASDVIPELRGLSPDALRINAPGAGVGSETSAERLVRAYHEAVPDEEWAKGHDAVMEYLAEKVPNLPANISPDQWRLLRDARANLKHVLETARETATLRAMENVIPFLDSHEQRSLFAEYGRNWLPFWYAEENFIKRWVRTASLGKVGLPGVSGTLPSLGLDQLRKMQLTYMGIKSAGGIRTDANGEDWVVYPGSGLLMEAVAKVLPGELEPIGVTMAANTNSILPGISDDNHIGPSPFITTPASFLLQLFPEAQGISDAIRGPIGSTKSIQSQFIPSTFSRMWEAAFSNEESSVRYNSAMNAAIAYAEAQGRGLPDNATGQQRDEYLDMIRNHARIIMVSQALVGFVAPGAPRTYVTGNTDYFAGLGFDDPKEVLSQKYRAMITEFGIEVGTEKFLENNPTADLEDLINPLALTAGGSTSPSRAPLPATEIGISWYVRNKKWVDSLPEAGAWFMPNDGESEFEYRAYQEQVTSGLRKRRTPQEFIDAMKFRTGATEYFSMKDDYDELVEAIGDNTAKKQQLDAVWDRWKMQYLAAHPLFAEQLQTGDGRIRRDRQIEQLRYAAQDPEAPDSPYTSAIQELVKMYDDFDALATVLRDRSDQASRNKLKQLKLVFDDWGTAWAMRNREIDRLWTSVYRIEAGI